MYTLLVSPPGQWIGLVIGLVFSLLGLEWPQFIVDLVFPYGPIFV